MWNAKMWGQSHPVNYWEMNMLVLASDWRRSSRPWRGACVTNVKQLAERDWRMTLLNISQSIPIMWHIVLINVLIHSSSLSFSTPAFSRPQSCSSVGAGANSSCPQAKARWHEETNNHSHSNLRLKYVKLPIHLTGILCAVLCQLEW